jgi:hypothetical protein
MVTVFLKRLLAAALLVAAARVSASAQLTTIVPNCSGANDTAAFSAIISAVGSNTATIRLPYKAGTRCAVNSLTIPANVTLDNTDGTGIKVNTGQTLTVAGPLSSPPGRQFFYNATAGLGTVSFAGNSSVGGIRPQWWGAKGDGATESQPGIQAAEKAAESAAGGVVALTCGTFNLGSTLTITAAKVRLVGEGKCSQLRATFSTGNIISATMATPSTRTEKSGLWGLEFRDFYIESSVNRTSGAAIYTEYTQGMVIDNVEIGTQNNDYNGGMGTSTLNMYEGIVAKYQDTVIVTNNRVFAKHGGVAVGGWWIGGVMPYFSYNGIIRGNTIYGNQTASSVGVLIGGGCGGLVLRDNDVGHFAEGQRLDTSLEPNGVKNREIFMGPSHFVDSSGTTGTHIAANGVDWLVWTDVWISFTGGFSFTPGYAGGTVGTGLLIDAGQPATQHIILNGGQIVTNRGDGIRTSGDGHLKISNVLIGDNGGGANGGHGLDTETSIDFVTLTGNTITGNGNGTRGNGVRFATAHGFPNVTGNLVASNGAANFSLPAITGTEIFEANHGTDDFGGAPTWVSTTLAGAWANFDPLWQPLEYGRGRLGRYEIRGIVKGGATGGSTLTTLPAGYRPSKNQQCTTVSNNVVGTLTIATSGTVTLTTADNSAVAINCSYWAQ